MSGCVTSAGRRGIKQTSDLALFDGAHSDHALHQMRRRRFPVECYGEAATRFTAPLSQADCVQWASTISPLRQPHLGWLALLIGSIRCECVDHIIVLGEAHLRRILNLVLITTTKSERIAP
jgi:hypothetical protein